jgi:hypothetical protein
MNESIEDAQTRIDDVIRKLDAAAPPNKDALVALLKSLKTEIGRLDDKHAEHAASMAGFAESAAHEATRKSRAPKLLGLSLDGLKQSVAGFELSHPRLVETIGEIGRELSSLGI